MRALVLSLVLGLAACHSVEGWTFDGRPLRAPVLDTATRTKREADLRTARAAHRAAPDDPDTIIWLGRRTAYLGRYRDKHLMATQVEVRAPLFWRFGGVVFGGLGDVAPKLTGFAFRSLKPTIGAGLRVRVDDVEGTNLRLDVAVGRRALGFYASFGEAF